MDDLKAKLKEKMESKKENNLDETIDEIVTEEEVVNETTEEIVTEIDEESEEFSNEEDLNDEITVDENIEGVIEDSVESVESVEVEETKEVEETREAEEAKLNFQEDYLNERLEAEEGINIENLNLQGEFCDSTGNPIEKQKEGKLQVSHIDLVDIHIPPRSKIFNLDIDDIEESIHMWGLIEPLHVIPYKDEEGDIKYILVHGYRRYLACQSLGMDTVPCVVDTTRPKEVVRYLEVIANNIKTYNFAEIMEFGKYIEERQKGFSHETIENILGLTNGLYLKSKYVDSAKYDFPDIYEKVVKNKMSVDAAFKKIEKEIEKGNEQPLDSLNQNGLPGGNDANYDTIEREANVQKKGERHPLDPGLRKAVEMRDKFCCQSCGLGNDNPSLSAIFHAHHMVPVKKQGADIEENLIMLCPNCHGFVHSIEEGRFRPTKDMVIGDSVLSNVVILANIIMRGLPIEYNGDAYRFYLEKANRDFMRGVEIPD